MVELGVPVAPHGSEGHSKIVLLLTSMAYPVSNHPRRWRLVGAQAAQWGPGFPSWLVKGPALGTQSSCPNVKFGAWVQAQQL